MDVRILTRIRHENSKHLPKFFNTTQLRSTPNFKKVFEIFVEELKTECFLAGHHLDLKDSQLERIFELLSLAKPDKKSNSYDVIVQMENVTLPDSSCVVRKLETVVILQADYLFRTSKDRTHKLVIVENDLAVFKSIAERCLPRLDKAYVKDYLGGDGFSDSITANFKIDSKISDSILENQTVKTNDFDVDKNFTRSIEENNYRFQHFAVEKEVIDSNSNNIVNHNNTSLETEEKSHIIPAQTIPTARQDTIESTMNGNQGFRR